MSDFWRKTLEAAAWTFLEAFLVTFVASMTGVVTGDWKAYGGAAVAAALAGAAAVVSLLKSVLVRNVGEKDSPLIS